MKIEVSVEVRPTESFERVKQALLNVFTPESMTVHPYGNSRIIVAKASSARSLRKLHRLLRHQRILDSAREYLKRGTTGNTITFYLNKQAAYMGVVTFCSDPEKESPLGPITFKIETKDPAAFMDWLAPKTIGGKPVNERKRPPDDP